MNISPDDYASAVVDLQRLSLKRIFLLCLASRSRVARSGACWSIRGSPSIFIKKGKYAAATAKRLQSGPVWKLLRRLSICVFFFEENSGATGHRAQPYTAKQEEVFFAAAAGIIFRFHCRAYSSLLFQPSRDNLFFSLF